MLRTALLSCRDLLKPWPDQGPKMPGSAANGVTS
jgi:hypothetical protein